MRIQRLELHNFRQFYGTQSIEFSGADPNDPRNVTVVYGENGRGKTGLYRAVMYCLFGLRIVDQDRNYDTDGDRFDEKNLYLVNLAAMEEDARTERKGVEAYVRLTFTHADKSYEMVRRLFGILRPNAQVVEEDREVKLHTTDASGNTRTLGQAEAEEIAAEIRQILDPRVKDYFLFDGERIERLTRVTSRQRKEVAQGIRNLLKIDELFSADEGINALDIRLNRELQKVSTGDYQKRLQEKGRLVEEQQKIEAEIKRLTNEIELGEDHVRRLDAELDKYKEMESAILRRKHLEEERDRLLADKDDLHNQMRAFTVEASVMLAKDLFDQLYLDLDRKKEKGQVPPDIRRELIERLLQAMKCICGREFTAGSAEYHLLKAWENVPMANIQTHLITLYSDLSAARAHINGQSALLTDHLQKSARIEEKLDQLNVKLNELNEQLGQAANTDIVAKNQARRAIQTKLGVLKSERNTQLERKDKVKAQLEEVERELPRLAKQQKEHRELSGQQELLSKSKTAIKRVIEAFVQDVRRELEEKANENFRRLLDMDGQKTLKAITVSEDYTLEVLDWMNRPFLANISAGQRQVVSLSFITALAQVAGGSSVLEIPLYMDTPFGRLSQEHRDNLLQVIPNITPQWVLLATEREFGADEAAQLTTSGKWGKFYVLEAQREGVTFITEKPLEYVQSLQEVKA